MSTDTTTTTTDLEARLAHLEDERDVRTIVSRMGTLIDRRDWDGCVALFCDPVRADWSALSGEPPAEVVPAELVGAWRANLAGLEATQHLTATHEIEVDGDEARCRCSVIGTHRLANPHGEPLWTVGGTYEHELRRTPEGWRIAAARLLPAWASGNQHVMTLAQGAGA